MMSDFPVTRRGAPELAVRAMLTRVADADVHADATLRFAMDDVFMAPDARLDDRTRAALGVLMAKLAGSIEDELRERAVRLLTMRGQTALADLLAFEGMPAVERLAGAGLLRDADFAGECLSRVRAELIGAALPFQGGEPDTPNLLARLAGSVDRMVAAAASAVMVGESHRRAAADGGPLAGTGLPAGLHARLLWRVAAVLRERAAADAGDALPALDRAIAEAAMRNLAAQADGDRLEGAAMRLAEAIDAQAEELPALLDEALRDRRLPLFAAFIAHALGVSFELARELVVEAAGERLWLVLRALDMPRDLIARAGFALCEADPRRDVEAFADALDVVMSVDPEDARVAIAPLCLHPDFRAALLALAVADVRR